MINEPALDLKGFVVFCYEEDGSLASLQDIALGFVEEIIGHYQRVLAKLTDARGIYGIWAPIPVNSRQNDWSVVVVPGFTNVWR